MKLGKLLKYISFCIKVHKLLLPLFCCDCSDCLRHILSTYKWLLPLFWCGFSDCLRHILSTHKWLLPLFWCGCSDCLRHILSTHKWLLPQSCCRCSDCHRQTLSRWHPPRWRTPSPGRLRSSRDGTRVMRGIDTRDGLVWGKLYGI